MKNVEMDYVVIGNSFWVPSRTFQGDMDEIRWGNVVSEPTVLLLMTLSGSAFLRGFLQKKR